MLESIDWSNAAIIAAFVGGGFAVGKEAVAFLFRLLEAGLAERRRRITLKSRISHLFAQTGIDSLRALEAWEAAVETQRALGLALGPQPPPIEFLNYEDASLIIDSVILTDELPDVVTALAKVHEVTEKTRQAFAAEMSQFGEAHFPYSFPRTRRLLQGLARLSITYLKTTTDRLPENPWDPSRGSRAAYKQASRNLERDFKAIRVPTDQEAQLELLEATRRIGGS